MKHPVINLELLLIIVALTSRPSNANLDANTNRTTNTTTNPLPPPLEPITLTLSDLGNAPLKLATHASLERLADDLVATTETSDARSQRLATAADHFERALLESSSPMPRNDLAELYHNLGLVRFVQHRLDEAVRLFSRAYELYNDGNDDDDRAVVLALVGKAWYGLGEWSRAVESLRSSVAMLTDRGLSSRGADDLRISALGILGHALFRLGELELALDSFRDALRIADLAVRSLSVDMLGLVSSMADVCVRLGRRDEAFGYNEQLVQLFDRMYSNVDIDDPTHPDPHLLTALTLTAQAYEQTDRTQPALDMYTRALRRLEATTTPSDNVDQQQRGKRLVGLLRKVGELSAKVGEHARSLECFERALGLVQRLGHSVAVVAVEDLLAEVGGAYDALGNVARAHRFYVEALEVYATRGGRAVDFDEPKLGALVGRLSAASERLGRSATRERAFHADSESDEERLRDEL